MSKGSKLVKGGIIGAFVGLVTGLLFAPKSGKETRKDIKDAANKAAREAEKKLKTLHDELLVKKDEAKELADKLKGKSSLELNRLVKKAEIARVKLGELISAVREGEVDESEVESATKSASKLSKDIDKKVKAKR